MSNSGKSHLRYIQREEKNRKKNMYFPKLSAESIAGLHSESLIIMGLTRFNNLKFPFESLELSKGAIIASSWNIKSAWARELRGEECWNEGRINEYKTKNEGKYETVNSYAGSSFKETRSFDHQSPWYGSDFYLEQQSYEGDGKNFQAIFERQLICALIGVSVLSGGAAYCAPQAKLFRFLNHEEAGGLGGNKSLLPYGSGEEVYEFNEDEVKSLLLINKLLMDQTHSESYLSSLRYIRSLSRMEYDDKVIDLMIGLEAMLSGSSEAGIALRVSQRLAHLLSKDKDGRRKIKEIVFKAYKYRSDLVHGNKRQADSLEDSLLKDRKDKQQIPSEEVMQISNDLTDLVREAIKHRYVKHGDKDKKKLYEHLDDLAV